MSEKFVWYSCDTQLHTKDHPPVDLAGALDIARKYYANADKQYATVEEASMETVFGIRRDDKTSVEISVHRPRNISFHFKTKTLLNPESSKVEKTLDHGYDSEVILKSWEELEERIREFYTQEPSEIRRRMAGDRASLSPGQVMFWGAFLVYLLVGVIVYGDRINLACNARTKCAADLGIMIWPYYVFGPGTAK
ncbi:MAG: hypothetical protein ACAH83_03860 [Alphaproteobacteria bacterium]